MNLAMTSLGTIGLELKSVFTRAGGKSAFYNFLTEKKQLWHRHMMSHDVPEFCTATVLLQSLHSITLPETRPAFLGQRVIFPDDRILMQRLNDKIRQLSETTDRVEIKAHHPAAKTLDGYRQDAIKNIPTVGELLINQTLQRARETNVIEFARK